MGEQNIILIGYMGAGKTSVGEMLARYAGKTLIDTDWLIEAAAGMDIPRIFETVGEAEFRRLETEVLTGLLDTADGDIISTGGGLPLREENRGILKKLGTVIYLQVEPQTVLERLKGDQTRPLLQAEDVEARVKSMLAERGPIYGSAAHRTVSVDGRTPEEIAGEIIGMTDYKKSGRIPG